MLLTACLRNAENRRFSAIEVVDLIAMPPPHVVDEPLLAERAALRKRFEDRVPTLGLSSSPFATLRSSCVK